MDADDPKLEDDPFYDLIGLAEGDGQSLSNEEIDQIVYDILPNKEHREKDSNLHNRLQRPAS